MAGVVFILLAITGIAAAAGATKSEEPSTPTATIWPMFQHDSAHSGRSQFDIRANPGLEKWEFTTQEDGAEAFSSPVIGPDGTIYVASDTLYALKPEGTLKWKSIIGGNSAPAIAADGTIYAIGTADPDYTNYLFAMTPDGRQRWKFATDDSSSAPVVGANGTIYFGCASQTYPEVGCLYAVKPNGQLEWKAVSGLAATTPAIDRQGAIYLGSTDHNLYAFDTNGKLRWKFATGGEVHGAPTVGPNDVIYLGSNDHYLYALNSDGTLRWKYRTGDGIDAGPAIAANGTIYFGSWDGYLYALTPSGKFKWRFATGNDVVASPAIGADGTIYVGSTSWNGELFAVSSSGKLKWTFPTDDTILQPPAIGADGSIYVTSYTDTYEHGSGAFIYALGNGGHRPTRIAASDSLKRWPDKENPAGENLIPQNWLAYNNPVLGLSFYYPPSMKVTEQAIGAGHKLHPTDLFPHLNARVTLDLTSGERALLTFNLSNHLTSDQVASDYRSTHDGDCGYATHLHLRDSQAIACAICLGASGCDWSVYLYQPTHECEIDVGQSMDDNFDGPLAGVQDGTYTEESDTQSYYFPLLPIIKTVRCAAPIGK